MDEELKRIVEDLMNEYDRAEFSDKCIDLISELTAYWTTMNPEEEEDEY